jgi:hypothetical protein
MESTLPAQQWGSGGLRSAKLFLYAAIILVIAEFIGSFTFKVGPGKVVLLPIAPHDLGASSWRCPGVGK